MRSLAQASEGRFESAVQWARSGCGPFSVLVTVLTIVSVPAAHAQGLFEGGFERDVNRYRWTSALELRQDLLGWRLDATNDFRSDAFILFNDRLSFRDENHTTVEISRRFDRRTAALYSHTAWYSLSRVFNQELLVGMTFPLVPKVQVQPLLGLAVDSRPGFSGGADRAPLRTDAGPAAGLRFVVPTTTFDDYSVEASGEALVQSLAPRRGDFLRASGSAERTFDRTRLRTQVQVATVRRDAYQAASFLNRDDTASRVAETVESTRSDTIAAAVMLDAPLLSNTTVSGRIDVSENRRRVETLRAPETALFFDSDFSRRVVEAEFSSTYARNQALLRLSFRAGAEVERRRLSNEADLPPGQASQKLNLLRQADYDRGYVLAQVSARAPLGFAVVQADVSANILRHDTPDVNLDDRDELYYNGRLGLSASPTRFVEVHLQLFGTYYHTVYLKAQRSAENNVQRSLRLRPSVTWRPNTGTRIEVSSEVRANYTVDDFLLPGRRASDQAARELRYDLDAEHEIGRGVRIRVSGRVSDLRLGRFLHEPFAEIPFDTLRTTSAWVRLSVGERVQAEVGMRAYIRSDYDRGTTVRYEREDEPGVPNSISRPGRRKIAQIGPTTSILWPLRGGKLIRVDGWATMQSVTNRLYGALPEGLEDVIRRAARRGTRTLIPNLAVTMQWRF